jgi:hypothetical protein
LKHFFTTETSFKNAKKYKTFGFVPEIFRQIVSTTENLNEPWFSENSKLRRSAKLHRTTQTPILNSKAISLKPTCH